MRPRGPLPPRVYWTRRVVLVGLVCLILGLIWWMLPGSGGSGSAAANPGGGKPASGAGGPATTPLTPSATGSTLHTPRATDATPASRRTGSSPGTSKGTSSASGHGTSAKRDRSPKLVPTGPCDPTSVVLAVDASSVKVGAGTKIGLRMSTPDGSTCSLAITPSLLDARITSGPATIWQSSSCPDALPVKNVVVGPQPRQVYAFPWDGKYNPNSCSTNAKDAAVGGYWAEAALVGGEPAKAYFEVTAKS